jgi:hypothetical protein
MSFLNLLIEHWQPILGLAILVVGVIICCRRNIDFTACDYPFRHRR